MEKAETKAKEGVQLTIIEKIEALMEENGVNQAALARGTGIGQAQLSKCLSRKGNNYFTVDALIKVSDYFKVTVDHLLGRTSLRNATKVRPNEEICRNLMNLMETNTVNVISHTIEEEIYHPNGDDSDNGSGPYRCEKKSGAYKTFYFSNYLPAPSEKKLEVSETDPASNGPYHPKGIEINAFIEYYLKLRDLYRKDDLPRAFFEQAMEDRLNQMRY